MTEAEQRAAATKFYNDWYGIGDEKSDSQRFWIEFCTNVLGIEDVTQKIKFEKRVIIDGQTKYIDGYIPETRVLIEQKSIDKDLNKKYQQSDGTMRTPFEQGRNYAQWMIPKETPLWIVVCNFKSFEIHDMNKPNEPAVIITLEEVRSKWSLFDFMFKKEVKQLSREMEVSVKAGEIVGILYDKLLEQYKEPDEQSFRSLNALCVRLVFCLYAEDAGIFGSHTMFHDYLINIPVKGFRKALLELFRILDTKVENREKYLAEDDPLLAAFPYVNGGLFADETIEIPPFTEEIKKLLLDKASAGFDWSDISPTIFGAVFESTLNPETRRCGGMHYTSIENIHKIIDPLFLNELRTEFCDIKSITVERVKRVKLIDFQTKIANLKFLDPACGSGNFLTETYISLRRLENEVLNELQKGQMVFGETLNPIQVSISQFYGIEINDFAVTVAKTALWIAESQMMKETEDIVHMNLDFLPLKSYANIREGNALQIDWESVVVKSELNYIMGNPPFIGARLMSTSQKSDMLSVFGKLKGLGNLDYVAAWYKKATEIMIGTSICAAFVSTNSITQGEQVAILWKPLFEKGVHINFAYRTFKWDSEAKDKAAVHCVIIGFGFKQQRKKKLFLNETTVHNTDNINAYLIEAPDIFIENHSSPICNVPTINYGSFALDDGNYTIKKEEYQELIKSDISNKQFLRPFIGAQELLHNIERYCVWLRGKDPADIQSHPLIKAKVERVQEWRRKSSRKNTVELANTPTLFAEIRQPETKYLAIPTVCSEKRRYIPMMFLEPEIVSSNQLYIVGNANLYHFGILMSNVHMAWMRAVCGRIKSDYRYSSAIVYNNFPWCSPTDEQKIKIERTAQDILDARALYPNSSLADLYDEILMPPELRKAHIQNDRAVMQAYGFSIKDTTEESCVANLMRMYQDIIGSK